MQVRRHLSMRPHALDDFYRRREYLLRSGRIGAGALKLRNAPTHSCNPLLAFADYLIDPGKLLGVIVAPLRPYNNVARL